MSNFTVSAKIEGDAKGLVQAAREGKAALEQIDSATKAVNAAQRDMAAAASTAIEALGRGDRAAIEMAGAQMQAAAAAQIVAQKSRDEAASLAVAQRAAREAAIAMEALARGHRSSADAATVHAAAEKKAADAVKSTAAAGALTAAQKQNLRFQTFDIATSLAGGMNPALIAMQQGPQILQTFDGPKDALTKILGLVGPVRLGLLGVAGVMAAGIAAHESYAASVREVDVALMLHGDRLGMTTQGYLALGRQIADTAGVSNREGREIVTALVNSGARSKEIFDQAAAAARGYAVATGQDAAEAAVTLAEKLKTPGKSARELSDQFNLLDETTIRQIESMERSGDMMGAQARLSEALNGKFSALADETSGWARAFEWLGNAASDAWDATGKFLFGGPGGISAIDGQIAALQKAVDAPRVAPGAAGRAGAMGQDDLAAQRAQLAVLQAVRNSWNAVAEARRKADEKAEESRRVGAIDARVNAEANAIQRLKDDEAAARKYLARADLSAEDRAMGERTLNGVLREQEEQRKRLAKQGETEGAKEAERLQERLTLQRQDLDLLQQIVAARAKGDDEAARRLQGQREAARRGFDLSTPDGRASAELETRSDQLADALKAMDDIEARMARLNPKVTAGANAEALAADLRAALRWKSETIAAFEGTGEAATAYGAKVETIFNDMVASAYEEDLRRRTDWAAGVQRAFIDLKRESEDFASVAERGIKDAAATIKDELISAALSGEASFDRLGDAFGRMILEMAYQKYLASQVEGAVGWAVDLVGSLFGLGSSTGAISGSGSGIGGGIGKRHSGSMGRDPFTSITTLPKHHDGWRGSGSGEHLAVIRNDEGVFTPRQMDNADRLIDAVANRPIIVNLADYRAGREAAASGEPKINVNLYGAPAGTQVEQRREANGDMTIDIMMDQMEDRMAMRIGQGRSPINTAIEQVYAGQRQVA